MRSTDKEIFNNNYSDLTDEDMVLLIQRGDDDALDYIFKKYKRLYLSRADRFFLASGGDQQDLIQEGMIGLYKAVRNFKPDQGTHFRAFADLCVTSQIKTAVSAYNAKKHQPLNNSENLENRISKESVSAGRKSMHHFTDDAGDPETLLINKESDQVRNLRDLHLSEMEKKVLYLFVNGLSYKEIGKVLGTSEKSVDNAMQRIKQKRRKFLCRKP